MELYIKKITPEDVFITTLELDEQKWRGNGVEGASIQKNRLSGNEFIDAIARLLSIYMMRPVGFYEKEMGLRAGVANQFILMYSGCTFREWSNGYIILAAKELLIQTDYNLETIGHRLGFSGISTFSRWFRNTEKETASNWRRIAKDRQAKENEELIQKLRAEGKL